MNITTTFVFDCTIAPQLVVPKSKLMGGSLQSAHHENLEAANLPQCSLRGVTHEARKKFSYLIIHTLSISWS